MAWVVDEIPSLRGYTVEWAEPGNFYLSRQNTIYRSTDLQQPFETVASVDSPSWKALASKFRLAQRLLRFMVTNVVPLAGGEIFVTFDKTVGVIRNGRYQRVDGLVRPCRVLRGACAVDGHGDVYFGEYLANTERGEMRVYRYSPGADSLEVAFTFPPGAIRHVHGIYYDEVTDSLMCLTGDDLAECRMMTTRDGFKTVQTVGEGDETWRAVSVLFDEDTIYYGMDAEYRTNHVYRLERSSLERRSLGEVNGTVFYSAKFGDTFFFATTAENASSQIENVAAIWCTTGSDDIREVAKFRKDRWNGTLFMFGLIHFPYKNKCPDGLHFSVVGVEKDARTFKLKRTDD